MLSLWSCRSVWGATGYGAGALSLAPDGASTLETNVSMMTSAVGTRGEPVGSRATARPRRRARDARSVRWRASQLDALAGAVGAQLADRRTARRERGGAARRRAPRPARHGGSPFASPALDPLVFSGPLTPHVAALPFGQPRPPRALVGRRTGG